MSAPTERKGGDPPRARLARNIAAQVRAWIESGEMLESRGRAVSAGDIMVLVRRRDALVEELVRAFKSAGIPVAGVDRMVLTEQIAVMDLMALGDFLLLPEDDLTLATVLKSPLIGFDDDRLYAVAHGRKGSVWAALNARGAAAPTDPEAEAVEALGALLARADFAGPYAFFAELLGAGGGRRKLVGRLGHDAGDPIDEFLAAATRAAAPRAPCRPCARRSARFPSRGFGPPSCRRRPRAAGRGRIWRSPPRLSRSTRTSIPR